MTGRLKALVALVAGVLVISAAGCGQDTSQKGLVESQKQIDEANKKLEGGSTTTAEPPAGPAQADP
jgi:uncharacterized lipoprotein YehR (DUF1307 family)